ncbi:MAG: hypothetical protein ABGW78_15420, partial [Pirellulales bacterium]
MTVLEKITESAVVLVTSELYHTDCRFCESTSPTNESFNTMCMFDLYAPTNRCFILLGQPGILFGEAASKNSLSLTYLLCLMIAAVALLLFLILRLRVQAFLSLMLASLFVAIGSSQELTGGAGDLELAN